MNEYTGSDATARSIIVHLSFAMDSKASVGDALLRIERGAALTFALQLIDQGQPFCCNSS